MDPQARGVIFGLDLSHSRAHIFRATLEAVMYGFRHHVDVLREAGLDPTRFLATNGGVSSSLWRQIAADVLNEPITSFRNHPGSVLGVAFVAGMAQGLFTDWTEIDRFLVDRCVNEPNRTPPPAYDSRLCDLSGVVSALTDALSDNRQPNWAFSTTTSPNLTLLLISEYNQRKGLTVSPIDRCTRTMSGQSAT